MKILYAITLLTLATIVAINVRAYFAPDRMCLGSGYFLLKNTDTFHSLHKRDSHFPQGFVEGVKVEGQYAYGYLMCCLNQDLMNAPVMNDVHAECSTPILPDATSSGRWG
jgi:hypothetical protein